MQNSPIRLVLVDEHLSYLESLAACLSAQPDLRVVGTAVNLEDALRVCLETRPNVGLFEVEINGQGTFDLLEEIRREQPLTKVLFLSASLCDVFIEQALRIGASGYLLKREPVTVLIESIRRAAAGDRCFSQEVEERLDFDSGRRRYSLRADGSLPCLTPRQLEVLLHLARGDTVKEVARKLHLSHKSVDSHKYRIMQRLGIRDRVHLARLAIREGLVLP